MLLCEIGILFNVSNIFLHNFDVGELYFNGNFFASSTA